MVHCPRSSHGDKVLNRPTVLAMWGVTLIDVPQWISLNLLCRKLSATFSLHGRALSSQHHGRLDLKDIKQICRFRECRALAPVWSCLSVAPAAHFIRVEESMCGLFSWEEDRQFQHRPECEYSTWLSVSSSLWHEILWKTTTCQNSQSATWEHEGRRWEEILATITLGYVCDRELRYLVTQLFFMPSTYKRDTWVEHLSSAVTLLCSCSSLTYKTL